MQVTITARHMQMTDALREYAEQKVRRITKYLDSIIDAKVILSVEKYRHIAEVTIRANGIKINGEEQTEDMYSSIDKVMDKIERQLRKHKGRVGSRQRGERKRTAGEEFEAPDLFMEDGGMPDETAPPADEVAIRIFKEEDFSLKPMSSEEAAMQMDLSGDHFLLFRNSSNESINLIFRRTDGNFGLIEP
ncbi:ribosome-associated translation inhibitor RaiA [bacterium]|nr:ribosome-associated translation inhibitor RaiA [candidate division CSSED10-310 bacterium]